jgi:hypothetical protein
VGDTKTTKDEKAGKEKEKEEPEELFLEGQYEMEAIIQKMRASWSVRQTLQVNVNIGGLALYQGRRWLIYTS